LTTDLPRIKIDLSFVGTGFNGFQLQKKGRTVQGELESALDEIGFPPKTVGCSRTDGGVHARRYTAHCADHEPGRKCSEILKGLNRNLPETILANAVSRAAPGFHARYSSLEKTYRYFIYVGDAAPPPVAPFVNEMRRQASAKKMTEILPLFIGELDFRAFTTSDGRKTNTVRGISSAAVLALEPLICIEIRGRSFLHRMVRFIAGALVAYSREKVTAGFLASALAGREDVLPFPAMPAMGLHLWDVDYGDLKTSEKYDNTCPLELWPFEGAGFRTVGRAGPKDHPPRS